jgi:hypothetical protein
LTVTYGARWDVNPPLNGKDTANDPFTVTGLDNPSTIALATRGAPLYSTDYGNVAPRVGVAYRLGRRTEWEATVRAGAGVFYDLGQGSLGGVTSYFPYGSSKLIQPSPAPFPLSAQDAAPPAFRLNPPGRHHSARSWRSNGATLISRIGNYRSHALSGKATSRHRRVAEFGTCL